MDIPGIGLQSTNAGTSIAAATTATGRTPGNQLDKDAFLQIMAAQLRYQDPLSGGDNTQYVAQMAQFSALEQMQNLNASISDMLAFQYLQFGSQLVGKSVTLNDGEQTVQGVVEKVRLASGDIELIVNGKSYTMDQVEEIGLAGSETEEPADTSDPGNDADPVIPPDTEEPAGADHAGSEETEQGVEG